MILRLRALFQDLADHTADPDTTVLDETWEITKDKMTRLEAIFEQVIDATPDAQKAATSALHESFIEEFLRVKVRVRRVLQPTTFNRNPSGSTSVHLPVLELQVFRGDPFDWVPWWNSFSTTVHSNPRLSDVDKFNYLRRYTDGEPRRAIRTLDITATNYVKALAILKKRYAQEQLLRTTHFTALIKLPEVTKRNDYKALRALYDDAVGHLRSLESAGIPDSSYNFFFISTMLTKLPEDLVADWRKQPNVDSATAETLIDFIEKEAGDREFAAIIKRPEKQAKVQQHQPQPAPASTVAQLSTAVDPHHSGEKRRDKGKKPKSRCLFCSGDHFPVRCSVPVHKRVEQVDKEGRCTRCLFKNHKAPDCSRAVPCRKCAGAHHTAICRKPTETAATPAASTSTAGPATPVIAGCTKVKGPVFLKVATVLVDGPAGPHRAICLIDDGCHRSFIKRSLAQTLKLDACDEERLAVQPFGHERPNKSEEFNTHCVSFRGTFQHAETIQVSVAEIDVINSVLPYRDSEFAQTLRAQGLQLADDRFSSEFHYSSEIELLIGADHIWDVVGEKTIASGEGFKAVDSKLGWLFLGPTSSWNRQQTLVTAMLVNNLMFDNNWQEAEPQPPTEQAATQDATQLSDGASSVSTSPDWLGSDTSHTCDAPAVDLTMFWKLEHLGIIDDDEEEDSLTLQAYDALITRDDHGRYVAPLPWTTNKWRLLDNRPLAEGRLMNLCRQLRRKPLLLQAYHEEIQQLLRQDFVEVANPEHDGIHTYLPHHPVIRQDKSTSKIRPVFDGSARTKGGPSLNQCLETGPNLNPNLLSVLLRFRTNRIAWIADIEKAFLSIKLPPDDSEAVRFLWPSDPTNPNSEVTAYKWKRVPFGLNSSPFVLRAVIRKHVDQRRAEYPEAVQLIEDQLYVDDELGGANDISSAQKIVTDTVQLFSEARMKMRKWITNDHQLQEFLVSSGLAANVDGTLGHIVTTSSTKVLGVKWNTETDDFLFDPTAICQAAAEVGPSPTKRQVLQISSRMFDPMGFISPAVLQLKILLQKQWEKQVKWDQPIDEEDARKWNLAVASLSALNRLRIPRWIGQVHRNSQVIELHVFADASKDAYGAVAYVRLLQEDGQVATTFLCSKTRVTPKPKKNISLPRLELLGALVATKLANHVVTAIKGPTWAVTLWSDSKVAIAWIQGDPNRWKVFVKNQVEKIRRLFNPNSWRHCPGHQNPADLASRGAPAATLEQSDLWWHGPPWLPAPPDEWPQQHAEPNESNSEVEEELRPTIVATVAVASVGEIPAIETTNSFIKLCRINAWVFRFYRRCKQQTLGSSDTARDLVHIEPDRTVEVECLSAAEINNATNAILRLVQREKYPEAYELLGKGRPLPHKNVLADLRPAWDPRDRLIRVTGRIELAIRDREEDPPILLPAKHRIVDNLIYETHHRLKHAGVRTTLSEVRAQHWIARGRRQVKRVLGISVRCQHFNKRHLDQVPASLPLNRIRQANPFEVVGLDFAGPLNVRVTRQTASTDQPDDQAQRTPQTTKAYICLFTCAVTRAVHLELVKDMTAETFMMACRRFFARRGVPATIYSDNAKTFKRTARYLQRLQQNPTVNDWLANSRITWKFSASMAPWWGGFWERMVRSVKDLLRKTIWRKSLDFEEMQTVLAEVEAAINLRPLAYFSEDADEPTPLTPAILISGRRPTTQPSGPAPDVQADTSTRDSLLQLERRRRLTVILWWKRWQREYLEDLKRFHSRGKSNGTIQVGQAVIIHDANSKRLMWNTGIVTELLPGEDGLVRAVNLRVTGNRILNRAIQCLYPLELQGDQPEQPALLPEHDGREDPLEAQPSQPMNPQPDHQPDLQLEPQRTDQPVQQLGPDPIPERPQQPQPRPESQQRDSAGEDVGNPAQQQRRRRGRDQQPEGPVVNSRGRPIRRPPRLDL